MSIKPIFTNISICSFLKVLQIGWKTTQKIEIEWKHPRYRIFVSSSSGLGFELRMSKKNIYAQVWAFKHGWDPASETTNASRLPYSSPSGHTVWESVEKKKHSCIPQMRLNTISKIKCVTLHIASRWKGGFRLLNPAQFAQQKSTKNDEDHRMQRETDPTWLRRRQPWCRRLISWSPSPSSSVLASHSLPLFLARDMAKARGDRLGRGARGSG